MTALVLGATGLIGSQVRAELERRGMDVVGTSTTPGRSDLAVDLTDAGQVEQLVGKLEPEIVVHAAGISSLAEAWAEPARNFEVNATGVLNLLEALRRHTPDARLVFTSTAAVYGPPEPEALPFTELAPLRPASPYAAAKAAAEVLCGQYEREHGMKVTVTRIFNQVGPGQSPSQAPSEFAREIALAEAAGRDRVKIGVGNPEAERDFTDASDTARAIADLAALGRPGTFNLCSGRATSLGEIIRLLGEVTRLDVSIAARPDHDRPADVRRITGSAAKLEAATGWQPRVPLGESLALLLDYWRTDSIRPHDD